MTDTERYIVETLLGLVIFAAAGLVAAVLYSPIGG